MITNLQNTINIQTSFHTYKAPASINDLILQNSNYQTIFNIETDEIIDNSNSDVFLEIKKGRTFKTTLKADSVANKSAVFTLPASSIPYGKAHYSAILKVIDKTSGDVFLASPVLFYVEEGSVDLCDSTNEDINWQSLSFLEFKDLISFLTKGAGSKVVSHYEEFGSTYKYKTPQEALASFVSPSDNEFAFIKDLDTNKTHEWFYHNTQWIQVTDDVGSNVNLSGYDTSAIADSKYLSNLISSDVAIGGFKIGELASLPSDGSIPSSLNQKDYFKYTGADNSQLNVKHNHYYQIDGASQRYIEISEQEYNTGFLDKKIKTNDLATKKELSGYQLDVGLHAVPKDGVGYISGFNPFSTLNLSGDRVRQDFDTVKDFELVDAGFTKESFELKKEHIDLLHLKTSILSVLNDSTEMPNLNLPKNKAIKDGYVASINSATDKENLMFIYGKILVNELALKNEDQHAGLPAATDIQTKAIVDTANHFSTKTVEGALGLNAELIKDLTQRLNNFDKVVFNKVIFSGDLAGTANGGISSFEFINNSPDSFAEGDILEVKLVDGSKIDYLEVPVVMNHLTGPYAELGSVHYNIEKKDNGNGTFTYTLWENNTSGNANANLKLAEVKTHTVQSAAVTFSDDTSWKTTKADVGVSYTKAETDNLIAGKADSGISYTKAETDTLIHTKADVGASYTKAETDALVGKIHEHLVDGGTIDNSNKATALPALTQQNVGTFFDYEADDDTVLNLIKGNHYLVISDTTETTFKYLLTERKPVGSSSSSGGANVKIDKIVEEVEDLKKNDWYPSLKFLLENKPTKAGTYTFNGETFNIKVFAYDYLIFTKNKEGDDTIVDGDLQGVHKVVFEEGSVNVSQTHLMKALLTPLNGQIRSVVGNLEIDGNHKDFFTRFFKNWTNLRAVDLDLTLKTHFDYIEMDYTEMFYGCQKLEHIIIRNLPIFRFKGDGMFENAVKWSNFYEFWDKINTDTNSPQLSSGNSMFSGVNVEVMNFHKLPSFELKRGGSFDYFFASDSCFAIINFDNLDASVISSTQNFFGNSNALETIALNYPISAEMHLWWKSMNGLTTEDALIYNKDGTVTKVNAHGHLTLPAGTYMVKTMRSGLPQLKA